MKLIVLDRDGVINFDSDLYIKSADEWRPIPGSMPAIARLNQHGYRVARHREPAAPGYGARVALHRPAHPSRPRRRDGTFSAGLHGGDALPAEDRRLHRAVGRRTARAHG